jgi:NAD(P)-dependent dehydrogenase (short-subunit alcohol dehydrogenase family)
LSTIKKSAEDFLGKEKKLDVLWNNAGVMVPPKGSKTKQGYELQLGSNNVGPFLFTKFLTPILQSTAKTSSPGSVRVVWLASSVAEAAAPKGGVDMDNLDYRVDKSGWHKYAVSKAGNILQSREFGRLHNGEGIFSVVCCNDRGKMRATNIVQVTEPWKFEDQSSAAYARLATTTPQPASTPTNSRSIYGAICWPIPGCQEWCLE